MAEPVVPWQDIRREMKVAPECLQKEKYAPSLYAVGQEDCLYMNIYTTKLYDESENSTALMPTLFYIHGGGFVNGNGSRYGAKYFMDEDVVLVTFNYRLGPFGFLNSMDGEIVANLGLKDQVTCLKWVKNYIKYFGGDPERVMIFGNSAGAFSVSGHMLSPMSQGLFHRAISQSGVTVCSGSMNLEPKTDVEELAKHFDCDSDTMKETVECLRNVDGEKLAVYMSSTIIYMPSLEYITDNENLENIFVSDYPSNSLQKGAGAKVPWIVGINSAEFNGFDDLRNATLINSLNNDWAGVAPKVFNYNGDSTDMSLKIKDFYFGNQTIGNHTVKSFNNLVADRIMNHCSKVAAAYQASYSDVYLYYLTKEPEKSYGEKERIGFPSFTYGVAHADELQFLFFYSGYPEIPKNSKYYEFSKMLVKIWSQFAATGDPNIFQVSEWKTIHPESNFVQWYRLDDNPQMVDTILPRMMFWDQFSHSDLRYL